MARCLIALVTWPSVALELVNAAQAVALAWIGGELWLARRERKNGQ